MIGYIVFFIFVASSVYMHNRGKVKYSLKRQITSHTNITAPINTFAYLCSKIPNTPFIDADEYYPDLKILDDNWEIIREEALALHKSKSIKASDDTDDMAFNSFFSTGWGRYYLKWYGDYLPSAQEHCPKTIELVKQIPYLKAAMFASLPPGAHLVEHRDPYAGSMRYHLGLITPNSDDCFINVDGENYSWRDGKSVVFDETFIHTAQNDTDQERVILFADIHRPMKYKWAESLSNWFSDNIVKVTTSKNEKGEKVGFLNRFFAQLYKVRIVSKKFKIYNRKLYYVTKFVLYFSIIWLIFF